MDMRANMQDDHPQAKRLSELPEYTQKFLNGLKEEEVDDLNEAILFMQSIKRVGRAFKWIIVTLAGAFIGGVALWDGFLKTKSWVFGSIIK